MLEDASITVSSVGIKFYLNPEKNLSLRKAGLKDVKSIFAKRKKQEFWALKDISFEAKKGEILGIIGSNGAGKSTLLKAIAGIYPVTEGKVEAEGNIAPLIELGAAFNPELTGTENIFLTGSIFRIPRKVIRQNFDRIIDFSGIKKFIDIPIKNYSSGMFIRLAFSIVIFFQPDIVLIDEVFSVGDESFQQKSFEKIMSFKEKGATILFVTHDVNLINQICDRAMVLSRGKVSYTGSAEDAVNHYHKLISQGEGFETGTGLEERGVPLPDSRRWGNRQVEITSVWFVDEEGNPKHTYTSGDYFEVQISYVSRLKEESPVFGIAIYTAYKMLIYGPNTLEKDFPEKIPEKGTVRFIIPSLPVFEGNYLFSASAYDPTLSTAYDHHDKMYNFQVLSRETADFGCVKIDSKWDIRDG